MKLTNEKMINFINLNIGEKHLPIRLAHAIALNAEAIAPAIKIYDKKRQELLEKYAEKDANGEIIAKDGHCNIIDQENWSRDFRELLESEAEITVTKISVDVLEKCDSDDFDSLSIGELSTIGFMIE